MSTNKSIFFSTKSWLAATIAVVLLNVLLLAFTVYANVLGAGMWFFGSAFLIIAILCLVVTISGATMLLRGVQLFPWFYQGALLFYIVVMIAAFSPASLMMWVWMTLIFFVAPSFLGICVAVLVDRDNQKAFNRLLSLIGITGSALFFVSIGLWFCWKGPSDLSAIRYALIEQIPSLALENPAKPGPYPVKILHYGSGSDYYRSHYGQNVDLKTKSVDGSPFISGWDGWTGWLRTYYWGFNASSLPLNGIVWYPDVDNQSFPLVLLVHGNHTMSDFSDIGYNYLGHLFATQGFIVVSVDENFFNITVYDEWSDLNEVAARGWLLLKHLDLWRQWNCDPRHFFFNRVDMENIALIGHSRGGEAIVTAKAFNSLTHYPENGLIPFDFNFSIKALAAIAPVDGQYLPAGNVTPLKNVNYFVMHGSHDGDIRSFQGAKVFSRLTFDDENYWFKSSLYIVGANHGQFNEIWGRSDSELPDAFFLNATPLLPYCQQKAVAEVYLSAFLRATLKDEQEYIPLFWDARLGKSWLPQTVLLNNFQDSSSQFLYAAKKDLDITKGTIAGTTISQENLTVWRQEKVTLKWGDKLNNAIFAGWQHKKGELIFNFSEAISSSLTAKSALLFTVADANESIVSKEEVGLINFTIQLADENRQYATLPLSHFSYLFPQIQTQVYKAEFFDTVKNSEVVLQSFRLPLQAFLQKNPHLQVEKLNTIKFIFNQTPQGVLIFDQVGFGT